MAGVGAMCDDRRFHLLRSGCEVPSVPSELSESMSRLILTGLADHTNTKGLVYVSSRTLATELNISPNTVFTAYRLFEREGILQRTGKRVGKGGTIEYQMTVERLTPQNRRFIPLPELRVSHPRTAPKTFSDRAQSEHRTDDLSNESIHRVAASITVTPTDPTIRERSRSGSRNQNSNQNIDSRAADIEVLFDDALNLELEYRPSQVPREALRAQKKHTYSQAAEKVLDTYPTARPSIQSDRDLALAVCEMMNPGDYRFQIGVTTRQVLHDRYQKNAIGLLSEQFVTDSDVDLGF